jgi:L-threonylcarbamoyladenylate synthase
VLNHGGIAVIPTDTLYGIVACAENPAAVRHLYSLRRKTRNKPFIVLLPNIRALHRFGVAATAAQKKFLSTVWPGTVSVILPCASRHLSYLHLGTQSLAFRVPKPKGLQSLLKKTGPLVAPSANPEGMKPALTMREANKYFGNAVALYVPGLVHRAPSSLVSLLGPTPVVIRRGTVKIS